LHVGIPAIATNLIGPVTAAYITRLMANYGETAVAGFGVAGRIEAVCFAACKADCRLVAICAAPIALALPHWRSAQPLSCTNSGFVWQL
jgi:hypothetical protein